MAKKTRTNGKATKANGKTRAAKREKLREFQIDLLPVKRGRLTPEAAQRWLLDELVDYQHFATEVSGNDTGKPEDGAAVYDFQCDLERMIYACTTAVGSGKPVRIVRHPLCAWETASHQAHLIGLIVNPDMDATDSDKRIVDRLIAALDGYLENSYSRFESAEQERELLTQARARDAVESAHA